MITSENPALEDKSKEQEVAERREKITELLSQGWTEKRIANELDVSYPTIIRDVRYLKEQAFEWVDDIAKTGLIFEVKKSVSELDYLKTKLYGYLDEDKLDVETKVKISRELREILDLKLNVLAQGPTLKGLKRVINQYVNGQQPTSPYTYSSNA